MADTAERASLPQRLGEFRIQGVLGEGAYGTVYAAEREVASSAGAPAQIALKVLRAELLPTERQRKQFLSEATLLASVDHPGVVKVLGFGLLPDDRPYLAMQRLDGESLADRLRRGPMAAGEALGRFAELCDALGALHERGLLHRDVKPENVFLAGAPARAMLFDFGIAKGADAPASTMTQDGAVRGTPAYMAPERFFGAPASTASEVYELGVTLYAMLVGRLPWDDPGDPESRLKPRRPSELGAPLAGELEAELLRALSTRAENRPASVRELAARVAAAAAAAPQAARRTLDLPAAEAAGQLAGQLGGVALAHGSGGGAGEAAGLPRAATVSGGALPGAGGPAPTEKVPRRSRVGTAAFALAAVGVAAGVGAVVGRIAWDDAPVVARAPDAGLPAPPAPPAPEPDPGPPPGPRTPALTRRVPDAVWTHHPADSGMLFALSWTQVIEHPQVQKALEDSDVKTPRMVAGWRRACGFDPVAELEWVTLGAPDQAGGGDADFIISGRWKREELERCLVKVTDSSLSPTELRREGALTWAKVGGREVWLGWIDEHTVFVTLRKGVDRAWVQARVAGKDPATRSPRLASLRQRVPGGDTVWLVAYPRAVFGAGEMAPGLATPERITAHVAFGDKISGEIRLGYDDDAQAEVVRAALAKQVEAFAKDPMAKVLLGDTAVTREGREVVLVIKPSPEATEAVVHGSIAACASELGKF